MCTGFQAEIGNFLIAWAANFGVEASKHQIGANRLQLDDLRVDSSGQSNS